VRSRITPPAGLVRGGVLVVGDRLEPGGAVPVCGALGVSAPGPRTIRIKAVLPTTVRSPKSQVGVRKHPKSWLERGASSSSRLANRGSPPFRPKRELSHDGRVPKDHPRDDGGRGRRQREAHEDAPACTGSRGWAGLGSGGARLDLGRRARHPRGRHPGGWVPPGNAVRAARPGRGGRLAGPPGCWPGDVIRSRPNFSSAEHRQGARGPGYRPRDTAELRPGARFTAS
jgi:hypothetical protein